MSRSTTGTQGNGRSTGGSISSDGRFVGFVSDATNLVSGDTNARRDAFVHDRQTGQTARIRTANGAQLNGEASPGLISLDGRIVAFSSNATNLVPNDSNATYDGFIAPNPLFP